MGLNLITANSSAIIDFARVSAPIDESGLYSGWIVMGMGMFVTFFCLTIIAFVITYLPKVLALFDKYFPEKNKVSPMNESFSSPVEAVAAAIAVAYHNHNSEGM